MRFHYSVVIYAIQVSDAVRTLAVFAESHPKHLRNENVDQFPKYPRPRNQNNSPFELSQRRDWSKTDTRKLQTAVWSQLGPDINGEAAGDLTGQSVSLSADGSTLAIGAVGNDGNGIDSGNVRVYRWNSSAWVQQGGDINGEAAGDWSGYSVSLSADGSTVAIGAFYHDGNDIDSGNVRVYHWNSSFWVQQGEDISGEAAGEWSGFSVSLSADGSAVASGAISNDDKGVDFGLVRVYRWNSTSWVQQGGDIDGVSGQSNSGYSVSLSADGYVVAIGAPYHDGNGNNSGNVRVFCWHSNSWVQQGDDINGEAAGVFSGYSVSLSADGSTVGIGSHGYDYNGPDSGNVRVFRWNSTAWIQQGGDINGKAAGDWSGVVSLSADGSTVAIGGYLNDDNGVDSGNVRVFRWNSGAWVQQGEDINGEAPGDGSGHSVSLSADGSTVAIGAIHHGSDSGNVRVMTQRTQPTVGLSDFVELTLTVWCDVAQNQTAFDLVCDASSEGFVGTINSSLVQGNCSAVNPLITSDGSQKSIHLLDSTFCKNNGSCGFTHCFRADGVYQNINIISNMTQVFTTITFDNVGTWSAVVTTNAFTAAGETAYSSRAANVRASIGACDVSARRRLQYGVGSTVNICVSTTDTDVALVLRDVKATPGNVTLVDNLAQPNFVTRVTNSGTRAVDLETLMIPTYYDLQGGNEGSIIIEGTAEIMYSRRHLEANVLAPEKEETSFSLSVPLLVKDYPAIPEVTEVQGGMGFRWPSLYTAMVAIVAVTAFLL